MKSGEMAANIARELAEHTKNHLYAGDITYSVSAMVQLVNLLDVQLRNLTPGGKDSAARSLNKVKTKGLGRGQEAEEGFGAPWRAIINVFLNNYHLGQWFFHSRQEYVAVFRLQCILFCWETKQL